MGLGSTAKKVQKLAETAEQLYAQLKDLRERVTNLEESVDATTDRVAELENDSEKQLVLLKEIAREHDIDVEQVLAEAAIDEAEAEGDEDAEADAEGRTDADAEPEPAAADEDGSQSDAADEAAGS